MPCTVVSPTATENVIYSYDVDANDPDTGDTLTFSLITFPSGMTINPATGVIQWEQATLGDHTVTVAVTDDGVPSPLTDTQSYPLTVSAIPSELVYTSTGDPINIGDNKTVSSSIDVSGTGLTVETLTLQINLTHEEPDDLSARLISSTDSPLDIEGPIAVSDYTHVYVVDGAGLPVDGTWTLQVTDDDKNRKRGSLIEWKMTVVPRAALLADLTVTGSEGSQASLAQQDAEIAIATSLGLWSQQSVTVPQVNVTVADLPARTLGRAYGNTITHDIVGGTDLTIETAANIDKVFLPLVPADYLDRPQSSPAAVNVRLFDDIADEETELLEEDLLDLIAAGRM